jgi:hypothetical protein
MKHSNRLPKRFVTCTRRNEGGGAKARQQEQGGEAGARGRRSRDASEVEAWRREGGEATARVWRRERGGGTVA